MKLKVLETETKDALTELSPQVTKGIESEQGCDQPYFCLLSSPSSFS